MISTHNKMNIWRLEVEDRNKWKPAVAVAVAVDVDGEENKGVKVIYSNLTVAAVPSNIS